MPKNHPEWQATKGGPRPTLADAGYSVTVLGGMDMAWRGLNEPSPEQQPLGAAEAEPAKNAEDVLNYAMAQYLGFSDDAPADAVKRAVESSGCIPRAVVLWLLNKAADLAAKQAAALATTTQEREEARGQFVELLESLMSNPYEPAGDINEDYVRGVNAAIDMQNCQLRAAIKSLSSPALPPKEE